ncbi:cell adhesion molecule DSCAM-like, partial [Oppia nitens]|uniref:cell adhesion molecule DSCAM-like n=1 Tax=Oppia nitens TaxID=1686743 RepID=UPI0023DA654F
MTLVAHQTIYLRCPVGGQYDDILWEKNGVLLPDNHRQTLHSNGTLIVRELSRETDAGRYSCMAKYKGDVSKRDFFVTVREKPIIEPFVVPSLVNTGQRLSITCTVIRGDPPLTIKWLYNDHIIGGGGGHNGGSREQLATVAVKVHHLTDYSSTLLFESLTKKQTGNYTCVAINDVGEDKHSTQMIIREKPRWIIEPTDHIDLVEGTGVWVDCSATGFPTPSVQWKRAQSMKSDYRPIVSSFQTQVHENGTLYIESADKKDSGLYLCHVSNGIEPDLSKIIRIQVHIAARFKVKFRAETFERNQRSVLNCEATGERPIIVEWLRDRQPIRPEHHSNRYVIKETVMNEGITSELMIESIDRSDSALYQCITSNAYGRDETSIQVIVQEPPDTPLDVKVDDISSRSARVSWAPPFTGNSRITKYHIYLNESPLNGPPMSMMMMSSTLPSQKRNITIPGTEMVWTISDLSPNNMYSLSVSAVNSLGMSQSSTPAINFQTDEEVPSDPPTHIKAHSNSSNTIRISWKAPDNQINFGSIKGYYIGYKVLSDITSDVYIYKTID